MRRQITCRSDDENIEYEEEEIQDEAMEGADWDNVIEYDATDKENIPEE